MEKCPNCDGQGLIGGNVDKPWLLEGHRQTCPVCKGTGNVQAGTKGVAPVDNSTEAKPKKGGILGLLGF